MLVRATTELEIYTCLAPCNTGGKQISIPNLALQRCLTCPLGEPQTIGITGEVWQLHLLCKERWILQVGQSLLPSLKLV